MTASISNTTQETCAICHEDYQGKEISDVTKVVELACHHFYHIGCIAQSLRYQERGQRDLTCCYCNKKNASSVRLENAFANRETFQARLEEIRGDSHCNDEEAISVVAGLYTSLHDLSNSLLESRDAVANQVEGGEQKPGFAQAIGDLVIKSEIKEDLKETVLRILAAMLTGDQALRTVNQEAEIWKNVPFENWPDKMKQEGILVRYEDEDIRMRISANHLKRQVDKIFVDTMISHYHKKAENFLQAVRSWAPWMILGGATVAVLAVKKF